ncbi:MAG: hypothetical protein RIC55_10810 [Pirellulaceae bacterium]
MTAKLAPEKFEHAATAEYEGILYALAFDESAHTAYAAGDDRALYAVDVGAAEPKLTKVAAHHDNYVSAIALRGEVVISAGYDGRILWTRAAGGEQLRDVAAHDGWIRDLTLLADDSQLASVGHDLCVRLWDAETGALLRVFEGHAATTPQGYVSAIYALAASPDGRYLASGDRVGEVRVWEIETGKLAATLASPAFYTYDASKRVRSIGGIRSLCFSPDGKQLAIAGIGQVTNVDGFVGPCRIELWDWAAGKRTFTGQDSHKAVLNHIAFDAGGEWLIAAGGGDSGGLLAFWDPSQEKPQHKAKPKGHIQRFHLDQSAGALYLAGHGGLQVWRTPPS